MSAGDWLPDELGAWPSDAYSVLGVRPGVDRRGLRKAYAALLHRFNPEHFPAHFRRLRDAYEIVLRHVQFNHPVLPRDEPRPTEEEQSTSFPESRSTEESDDIDKVTHSRADGERRAAIDEPEALWKLALAGDTTAYRRFVELESRSPGRRELCARLYWLLIAWPELDADRDPCDWLARGMRASLLTGPLAELYGRELEQRPAEALTVRCADLLDCAASPSALADLIASRCRAAGKIDQFDIIAEDLEFLRNWFLPDAEEIWAHLLLLAVDQLSWSSSAETQAQAQEYWKELEEMPHLHTQLVASLDRTDLLRLVAVGWHKVRAIGGAPEELLQLVRWSLLLDEREVARRSLPVLYEFWSARGQMLKVFDRIQRISLPVLSQVGRIISICEQDRPTHHASPDESHIVAMAQHAIGSRLRHSYPELRPHLLTFCLRERIAPDRLIVLAEDRPLVQPTLAALQLVEKMTADAPLQLAYRACRVLEG